MRVTVSGPPGSGTTSLSEYLILKHGFTLISAGEIFRTMAAEEGMDLADFGRLAEEDPSVDRLIDERQKEIGESKDNIVIEGRLAGHMIDNADLKIWVSASLECRALRIAEREGLSPAVATDLTAERDECEAGRYAGYYEIDISDLSVYDLVVSSEKWGREELGRIIDVAIENLNLSVGP